MDMEQSVQINLINGRDFFTIPFYFNIVERSFVRKKTGRHVKVDGNKFRKKRVCNAHLFVSAWEKKKGKLG